jgi:hypothetical protein
MESEPLTNLLDFGRALALLIVTAVEALSKLAESADRQHNRGELLAAYKVRHSWKRSDLAPLRSLPLNAPARERTLGLRGTGRPVVRPHKPLAEVIRTKIESIRPLFDSSCHPSERVRAVKVWPWFNHYVEAMYRGEHRLAKQRQIAGPSSHAEWEVGKTLGLSPSKVHSICGEIRRLRQEDCESADFPPMTVSEFEQWMTTGNMPDF